MILFHDTRYAPSSLGGGVVRYRREQNGVFPSSIQEKDSRKFAVFSKPLLLASFSQPFHDPRSAVDEVPDKHDQPSDDRDIEVPQ